MVIKLTNVLLKTQVLSLFNSLINGIIELKIIIKYETLLPIKPTLGKCLK